MSSDEALRPECEAGQHHKKCRCYEHPPVDNSLVQSTAEMEFEVGLWYQCQSKSVDSVRAWLARQSDDRQRMWANKRDPSNYTPLHYAARRRDGDVEVTDILLRLGADPNAFTPETRMTPLMRAAACRHVGIVALLLKAGAKKEFRDERGLTAFDWVEQNLFPSAAVTQDAAVRQTLLAMLKVDEKPAENAAVNVDAEAAVKQ
jgi:hypothetical protein